jgi:predicted AlkP superfamily pyrophosphatase or phosphodiesterase
MSLRRVLSLSLVLVLLAACAGGTLASRGGRNGGARASLVVVITVDQLGSDYLDRYGTELSAGLRRLLDESAVWPRGMHDHAITETAPGHATRRA